MTDGLVQVTVAKHVGLQTLRLADSVILPINTTHYAYELEVYLQKYVVLVYRLSAVDSTPCFCRVEALNLTSELDFSSLRRSIKALQAASLRLDQDKLFAERQLHHVCRKRQHISIRRRMWSNLRKALGGQGDGENHSAQSRCTRALNRVKRANTKLASFERGFTSEEGIKGREWCRHLGVAPGKWTGW